MIDFFSLALRTIALAMTTRCGVTTTRSRMSFLASDSFKWSPTGVSQSVFVALLGESFFLLVPDIAFLMDEACIFYRVSIRCIQSV